jgi:hypothetical protein
VTLLFGVVQASGFSGCNNFTLPYAVQDTGLRFGPIAGTRASCGPTLDAVETAYYTNLSLVTGDRRDRPELCANGPPDRRRAVDDHDG